MLLEFAFAALCALAVSFVLCRMVIAAGIEDAPKAERNVHKAPTPTSGGYAIAAGVAAGAVLLTAPFMQSWTAQVPADAFRHAAGALAVSIGFLLIGGVDDVRALGPIIKFVIFGVLALAIAHIVARVDPFVLGPHLVLTLGATASTIGTALFVFTMVNTVNFIDGANGLASGSTAIGLMGIAAIALSAGAPHVAALAICGVGAIIGFLFWNFPKARLFAGDAGALFMGSIAASVSLMLVVDGGVTPFAPVICFLPMLADVLLTLLWRLPRRPKLLEGHRDHHFHIGMRAGMSHKRVAIVYWIVTAHCAAAAFIASVAARGAMRHPGDGAHDWVGYLPMLVFLAFTATALAASARIRKFAKARGYDAP